MDTKRGTAFTDGAEALYESLSHVDDHVYAVWKRNGHHITEYASELAGTAFLAFAVVAVVALMFAPSSPVPALIPPVPLRLFLAGLLIGSSGWLVALSPPGKLSGAHINPAISIGFLLLKKMYPRDAVCYVVAQMVGGFLGAYVGVLACGRLAVQVHDAALAPSVGLGASGAFALEFATTAALAAVIFYCVSHPALAPRTPMFVTLSAGCLVLLDGNLSGAGMNPARWIGPAALAHVWSLGWIYVTAPIAGAVAVAVVRRLAGHRAPITAKMLHDINYRSIFKHDEIETKAHR